MEENIRNILEEVFKLKENDIESIKEYEDRFAVTLTKYCTFSLYFSNQNFINKLQEYDVMFYKAFDSMKIVFYKK